MKNGIWLNLRAMQLWNVTGVKESRKIVLFATFVSQFKGKNCPGPGCKLILLIQSLNFKPDQTEYFPPKIRISENVSAQSNFIHFEKRVKRVRLFAKSLI